MTVERRTTLLVSLYERQIITARELANKLTECAANPVFFEHLGLVPPASIAEFRQIALDAPSHPEDFIIIHGDRVLYYWGARHLREHFYPELPPPLFEPVKLIGVVREVIERDGSVVIFGRLNSSIIWANPIDLVTPVGNRIRTSVIRQEYIKRECDATSSEWEVREAGQHALFLGKEVKTIADVPLQTEVWVDRSAVAELRPPF